MKFDLVNILALLIFSSAGLIYIKYGKTSGEMRFVVAGVLLLVYGYFTPSIAWSIILGAIFAVSPFVRRLW